MWLIFNLVVQLKNIYLFIIYPGYLNSGGESWALVNPIQAGLNKNIELKAGTKGDFSAWSNKWANRPELAR